MGFLSSLFGGKPEKEKPGALEVEMLRQSREKWDRYQNDFKPMEQEFIDRVRSYDSREMKQDLVNTSVNTARHGMGNIAPPAGVTPGGPAFKRAMVDSENATGKVLGSAGASGEHAGEDRYAKGVSQLVRIGRGLSGSADAGLAHASAMEAGNIAADTAYDNRRKSERIGMAGEALGMAGYAGGAKAGWWGPNKGGGNLDVGGPGLPMGNGDSFRGYS